MLYNFISTKFLSSFYIETYINSPKTVQNNKKPIVAIIKHNKVLMS